MPAQIATNLITKQFMEQNMCQTKSETCLVEAFNSLLRYYVPYLARKTKAYAKSRNGLNCAIKFFMFKHIICA
jgi:IS1 family transposase